MSEPKRTIDEFLNDIIKYKEDLFLGDDQGMVDVEIELNVYTNYEHLADIIEAIGHISGCLNRESLNHTLYDNLVKLSQMIAAIRLDDGKLVKEVMKKEII